MTSLPLEWFPYPQLAWGSSSVRCGNDLVFFLDFLLSIRLVPGLDVWFTYSNTEIMEREVQSTSPSVVFLSINNSAAFVVGHAFRLVPTLPLLRAECLDMENQLMSLVPRNLNKAWRLHPTCPVTLRSFCSVKSADMPGPVVSYLRLSLPGLLQSAQTSPPHVNLTILFATNCLVSADTCGNLHLV